MVIDRTRSDLQCTLSKIAAIAEMPKSSSGEELRLFLGFTGYLRQFIEKYSLVAAPLNGLLYSHMVVSQS